MAWRPGAVTGTLLGLGLAAALAVGATSRVVVEDWSTHEPGATGVPTGWKKQSWNGKAKYDFVIVEAEGRKAIHLRSQSDSSTIGKDITGKVDLAHTPVLEWRWKVVALPGGGDARTKDRDDQAAQLYVVWPRFPEALRSRVIGYVWDATAPAGETVTSQKTKTVTYVIVRSGSAEAGRWLTERRDVRADYRRIFGEDPPNPGAIAVGIDSDDVKGSAEAFVGSVVFTAP